MSKADLFSFNVVDQLIFSTISDASCPVPHCIYSHVPVYEMQLKCERRTAAMTKDSWNSKYLLKILLLIKPFRSNFFPNKLTGRKKGNTYSVSENLPPTGSHCYGNVQHYTQRKQQHHLGQERILKGVGNALTQDSIQQSIMLEKTEEFFCSLHPKALAMKKTKPKHPLLWSHQTS